MYIKSKLYKIIFLAIFFLFLPSCDYFDRGFPLNPAGLHSIHTFLHSSSAVISDAFIIRSGGRISCLNQTKDRQWQLSQQIDIKRITSTLIPLHFLSNGKWLCMFSIKKPTSERPLHLHLLKKNGGRYEPVPVPEMLSNQIEQANAFFLDDHSTLYISQTCSNESLQERYVVCFDLNDFSVTNIIKSPNAHSTGFAHDLLSNGKIFVTNDYSLKFEKNDYEKYGLTLDDRRRRSDDDIERQNFLVFHFKDGKWVYETDLYELLPHPEQGLLRENVQSFNSNTSMMYYPVMTLFFYKTVLFEDEIYLAGAQDFFHFKRQNDNWSFVKRIKCKNLHSKPMEPNEEKSLFYHYGGLRLTNLVAIGNKYSVGFCDDGFFEVYKTAELDRFEPLFRVPFDQYEISSPKKYFGTESDPHREAYIYDDTIIVQYQYRDYKDRSSFGETIFYEIADKEIHETFRMCQNRNQMLTAVESTGPRQTFAAKHGSETPLVQEGQNISQK